MKNKIYYLVLLFACHGLAIANSLEQLQYKIDELVKFNFGNAMFGLVLQEADSGKVLYEREASTSFIPASATKLFTAAAALHKLTPKFRFQTILKYEKRKVKNGVLTGPVAITFKGDPSLTSADFKKLIHSIKQANITAIKGNLIIDDSYFQGAKIGPGWIYDDAAWHYAGPISAIIIDENLVNVTIIPNQQLERSAEVSLPVISKKYFKLTSAVNTVTWQESEELCQIQVAMDNANHINVTGCWPIGHDKINLRLAINNSRKFATTIIQEALLAEKIHFTGKVVYDKVPANLTTLAVHLSLPLGKLLPKVLADSNNIYAEAITKTLGAEVFNNGSFQAGTLAIKNILQQPTGINFSNLKLVDGSGLSRYNLITPHQFARLLYTMYHSATLKQPYGRALALAGVKGTLNTRLSSFDTYEKIKAKTGSMNGISALSGYITTRTNKALIFTMLINNTLQPLSKIRKIEDELCQLIVNHVQ